MIRRGAMSFCTIEHMAQYGLKKGRIAIKKNENKKNREEKQKLKTLSDHIKEAQVAFNKYIRARDINKPCISSGTFAVQKIGGNIDAGHYRSRGSAGHLRFNSFNCHAQCVKDNRYGSGNVVEYRINLIKRIGLHRVERLENDNKIKKFNAEYLIRLKKIFNKRARHVMRFR